MCIRDSYRPSSARSPQGDREESVVGPAAAAPLSRGLRWGLDHQQPLHAHEHPGPAGRAPERERAG
eukprot:11546106-Alexandrium_andersonii.AAC.1